MTPLTYHLLWDTCWATLAICLLLLVFATCADVASHGKCRYQKWQPYMAALMWTFATLRLASLLVIVLCQTFVGHPDFLKESWNNRYHLVHP